MHFKIIRESGVVTGAVFTRTDGSGGSFLKNVHADMWAEFLRWNAVQENPLDLSDKEPEGPTLKEMETNRRLSVAVAILRAIPDTWETGTPQQQISWACKQALRRIAAEIE